MEVCIIGHLDGAKTLVDQSKTVVANSVGVVGCTLSSVGICSACSWCEVDVICLAKMTLEIWPVFIDRIKTITLEDG